MHDQLVKLQNVCSEMLAANMLTEQQPSMSRNMLSYMGWPASESLIDKLKRK